MKNTYASVFCLFSYSNDTIFLYRNDTFIIFSGGMPAQTDSQQTVATNASNSTPSKPSSFFLTILLGQTTNVLHMDNTIIDFHIVTPSPHIAGM